MYFLHAPRPPLLDSSRTPRHPLRHRLLRPGLHEQTHRYVLPLSCRPLRGISLRNGPRRNPTRFDDRCPFGQMGTCPISAPACTFSRDGRPGHLFSDPSRGATRTCVVLGLSPLATPQCRGRHRTLSFSDRDSSRHPPRLPGDARHVPREWRNRPSLASCRARPSDRSLHQKMEVRTHAPLQSTRSLPVSAAGTRPNARHLRQLR